MTENAQPSLAHDSSDFTGEVEHDRSSIIRDSIYCGPPAFGALAGLEI